MVFVLLNADNRPWMAQQGGKKAQAFSTLPEAEWQAWEISHRRVMDSGNSFAEVIIREVEFDDDKMELHLGVDLNVNQIDTKTDKQGKLLKVGNYTVATKGE